MQADKNIVKTESKNVSNTSENHISQSGTELRERLYMKFTRFHLKLRLKNEPFVQQGFSGVSKSNHRWGAIMEV